MLWNGWVGICACLPLGSIVATHQPLSAMGLPAPGRGYFFGSAETSRIGMGRLGLAIVALLGLGAVAAAEAPQLQLPPQLPGNDYPTVTRADYVFACMQVNGQTRDALERCSCSIDAIASLLPYEKYEEAETIMRVRQRGGRNASMFLSTPQLRAKVDDLKRAQVEAELRCF